MFSLRPRGIYYSVTCLRNLLTELGLVEVGEPCLQASLIQFSVDQKPERSPTQMAIAATEWKLLAVAHPIKKQLLSTITLFLIWRQRPFACFVRKYIPLWGGGLLRKRLLLLLGAWCRGAVPDLNIFHF